MISEENTQVWANVPKPLKKRLETLRAIDHVLYSESRVIWRCIEAHLGHVEAEVKRFRRPTRRTPSRPVPTV